MKRLIFLIWVILPTIFYAQTLEEALGYGLPVVVVNTINGEEPTAELIDHPEGCVGYGITNVLKVPGRVMIYLPDEAETPAYDSGEYVNDKSGMTFKIHGNSSALATAKRPYKIKLQKKADLLLRGDSKYSDKDWALLKAMPVSPLFRCPIATTVGNKVTEILKVTDWVPASRYVNLIVNGDFRGFYQLTETIKRNEKCRISVHKDAGYIAEIDPYYWNEDVYVESSFLLKNSYPYQFTFKYPDSDDITEEELAVFKEYIDLFDASISRGTYPLYIDVESCARWLLAHQLLGTKDGAGSNVYLIRRDDQSKLEMGPLWDFDSIFWVQGSWTDIMEYHYFEWMLRNSPNRLLAREIIRIWSSEKEHILSEVLNYIDSLVGTDYAEAIDKSTEANYMKWRNKPLDKMEVSVEKLKDWFSTRAKDLDFLLTTLNTIDGDSTHVDVIQGKKQVNKQISKKVLKDKSLYIIRNDETYSIDGKKIGFTPCTYKK